MTQKYKLTLLIDQKKAQKGGPSSILGSTDFPLNKLPFPSLFESA